MISSFYQEKLPAEFMRDWPQETRADCSNCNMALPKQDIYKPDLKCCTYMPFLPQFSVGQYLKQKKSLSKIKNMILTPLGLCASPAYQTKHRMMGSQEFGRREDLLCSFYLSSGGCDIWSFRNSQCSTYFCESSYGEDGQEFLKLVRSFLYHYELSVSQRIMLEKGYSWEEVEQCLEWVRIDRLDQDMADLEQFSKGKNQELWQHWHGKEIQYYSESLHLYSAWSWQDIKAMLDPETLLIFDQIQEMKGDLLGN